MSEEPKIDPRLARFGLTRRFGDRLFCSLLGVFVSAASGYLLAYRANLGQPKDSKFRIADLCLEEFFFAFFLLGLCFFVWGIAAPRWLEHFFARSLAKFVLLLAVIAFLLAVASIWLLRSGG